MHSGQSPDLVPVPEGPVGARCVRTSVPALFSFFSVALLDRTNCSGRGAQDNHLDFHIGSVMSSDRVQ